MGQTFNWKQYNENSIVSPISGLTGIILALHYSAIEREKKKPKVFCFHLDSGKSLSVS